MIHNDKHKYCWLSSSSPQVKVKVVGLCGRLPLRRKQPEDGPSCRPTAAHVVATLIADGEVLGLECKTTYAETSLQECSWSQWLTFCVKYRDLPANTQLSLAVFEMGESQGQLLVGGTNMALFNKHGRLKTGPQRLRIWEGQAPHPVNTPGKVPLSQRGELGRLEHLAKLYARGDLRHVDWLDEMAFKVGGPAGSVTGYSVAVRI